VFRAPNTNAFDSDEASYTSGTQTITSWTSVALAGGTWV